MEDREPVRQEIDKERFEILEQLEDWLETPLVVLGFVWLALLVVELTWGFSPILETATTIIWIIFIADFLVKLILAPRKLEYLRSSWLTALSLLLPALRVLRFVRVVRLARLARAARGVRLARVLTSLNRGMRALGSTMQSRGFPYVAMLTVIVLLLGAAGMFAFEREEGNATGFATFSGALWWTAMLLTTMGSEYWPRTAEGRLVCLLLSIYAFAVFGYITATLASYFVGSDAVQERQRADRLEAELVAIRRALETR